VLFAIAAEGGGQAFKDVAFLVIAPLILVYNVTAVLVLVAGAGQAGTPLGRQMRSIVTHTVTNPLLIATAAGLAWAATGWRLPLILDRTLTGVGQISSPLALIGLGATLSFASVRGQAVRTAAGALLKTGFGPLAAWVIGTAMGLGPGELRVVLIYAACPTAAAAFVMAEQMGADHLLTNGIVVVSVVLAVPALVVVLLI
jgi:predicted permease